MWESNSRPSYTNPKFSIQPGFTLQTTTAFGLKLISRLEIRVGNTERATSIFQNLQIWYFEASRKGVQPKLEMMARLNHLAQGSEVHFILNYFYYQHYLQTYSCNLSQILAPSYYVKRKEKEINIKCNNMLKVKRLSSLTFVGWFVPHFSHKLYIVYVCSCPLAIARF